MAHGMNNSCDIVDMLIPIFSLLLVTRYIQKSAPKPGVESINISCITTPSVPPVRCHASISCEISTVVIIEIMDFAVYITTQPCNISVMASVAVNSNPEILDQEIFIDVLPLPQPTTPTATTTTLGLTPRMPPIDA